MLEELSLACEASDCDRTLTGSDCMLVFQTAAGKRCAYECACGEVTITVKREKEPAGV